MSNAFKAFKERIAGLWGKGKETLKDIVEEEAEKEHKEDQEAAAGKHQSNTSRT